MEPKERMKSLVDISQRFAFEDNIQIVKYFKSAREMIKRANSLEEEGDLEKAFVLYLRFVTLYLQKIVTHTDFKKADSKEKKFFKEQANVIFDKAEKLKPILMERFASDFNCKQNEKINDSASTSLPNDRLGN